MAVTLDTTPRRRTRRFLISGVLVLGCALVVVLLVAAATDERGATSPSGTGSAAEHYTVTIDAARNHELQHAGLSEDNFGSGGIDVLSDAELRLHFHVDGCSGAAKVDLTYTPEAVTVNLWTGKRGSGLCLLVSKPAQVTVDLPKPLAGRSVREGHVEPPPDDPTPPAP
jgi:hypothetical protein